MKEEQLQWRVHTPNLLKEVLENNNGMGLLQKPFLIFMDLLSQVADRAIIIDDKELNKLMLRLTLYENADPTSDKYDGKRIDAYLKS